jgi:hypothetical protein
MSQPEEKEKEKVKLDTLKKELEDKGFESVMKLRKEKELTLDNLSKLLEQGQKEFTEKTGRQMSYSEMREMYG